MKKEMLIIFPENKNKKTKRSNELTIVRSLGRSKLIICSTSSFNKKFEGGGDFIQTNIKKQTYKIYIINMIKTYRE